jgi:hypothetical protein
MVENALLETSQLMRELDRRLAPDFQSSESSRSRMTELNVSDTPPLSVADTLSHQKAKASTSRNLQAIQEEPGPLDQIANLVLGLSYGQMIELCDAMWNNRPANSPVTQEKLPPLVHRWAKSHASAARNALGKTQPE